MKIFKRVTSVFLATLLLLSSMSAMAEFNDGKMRSLISQVRFYRAVDEDGTMVETTRVSPGDSVEARIVLKSDFVSGPIHLYYLFNSDVFSISEDQATTLAVGDEGGNDYVGGDISWSNTSADNFLMNKGILDSSVYDNFSSLVIDVNVGESHIFDGETEYFAIKMDVAEEIDVDTIGTMFIPSETVMPLNPNDGDSTFLRYPTYTSRAAVAEDVGVDYGTLITTQSCDWAPDNFEIYNAYSDNISSVGTSQGFTAEEIAENTVRPYNNTTTTSSFVSVSNQVNVNFFVPSDNYSVILNEGTDDEEEYIITWQTADSYESGKYSGKTYYYNFNNASEQTASVFEGVVPTVPTARDYIQNIPEGYYFAGWMPFTWDEMEEGLDIEKSGALSYMTTAPSISDTVEGTCYEWPSATQAKDKNTATSYIDSWDGYVADPNAAVMKAVTSENYGDYINEDGELNLIAVILPIPVDDFTVTWNAYSKPDGTPVDASTESIAPGDTVAEKAVDEVSGYDFVWYIDADGDGELDDNEEVTFPYTVNSDIAFSGEYVKTTATVTWKYKVPGAAEDTVVNEDKAIGAEIGDHSHDEVTGYTFAWDKAATTTVPAEGITVTGTYTPIKYDIKWVIDGAEKHTEQVDFGTPKASFPTYTAPDAETGYEFSGWSTEFSGDTMPAAAITYTGSYNKINYTIKWMYTDTDNTQKQKGEDATITIGSAITAPQMEQKTGYTFAWTNAPEEFTADVITGNNNPVNKVVNGVLTVSGAYTPVSYTVKWDYKDTEGATKTAQAINDLNKGAALTDPTAPTAAGYTFAWDTHDATLTDTLIGKADENNVITLEGAFTPIDYTVVWQYDDLSGATQTAKTQENVHIGDTLTDPTAPTATNWTFAWNTHDAKLTEALIATAQNKVITLTGAFTQSGAKVTWKYKVPGAAEDTVIEENKAIGAQIGSHSYDEVTGYTFAWDKAATTTVPAEGITVTGTYTPKEYDMEWVIDETVKETKKVAYGTLKADFPTYDAPEAPLGYKFSGWSEFAGDSMPAAKVTITGSYDPITYTLVFDPNEEKWADGTNEPVEISYPYESDIDKVADKAIKGGCEFIEWIVPETSIAVDAKGQIAGKDEAIAKYAADNNTTTIRFVPHWYVDVTLNFYAKNTKENKLNLIDSVKFYDEYEDADYRPGDYYVGEPDLADITEDDDIANGYVATAWSTTEADGVGTADGIVNFDTDVEGFKIPGQNEVNFYAVLEAKYYSTENDSDEDPDNNGNVVYNSGVSFNLNYEGAPDAVKMPATFDAKITAPADPTRDGYTFKFWGDSEDATAESEQLAKLTVDLADEDLTLYAIWEAESYGEGKKVTFLKNDGTEDVFAEIGGQTFNEALVVPDSEPAYAGHFFKFWGDSEDATAESAQVAKLTTDLDTTDLVLYAIWGEKTYKTEEDPTPDDPTDDDPSIVYGLGVTFDANGGKFGEKETVKVGGTFGADVVKPENEPKQTGYVFTGYAASEDGTVIDPWAEKVGDLETVPQTYYAQWKAIEYKAEDDPTPDDPTDDDPAVVYGAGITFLANGGKWADNSTEKKIGQTFGAKTAVPAADPTMDGKNFAGWATDSSAATGVTSAALAENDMLTDLKATPVTYYAIWSNSETTPYTVKVSTQKTDGTYEDKDYELTGLNEAVVSYADVAAAIKSNYNVDICPEGFSTEDGEATFTVAPNGTFDIQIDRTQPLFTVDAANGSEPTVSPIYFGAVVTAPETPEKDGYEFDKWVYADDSAVDFTNLTMPVGGLSIKATYKAKSNNSGSVNVYQQKADQSGYVLVDTITLENLTTDAEYTYDNSAISYDGFEYNAEKSNNATITVSVGSDNVINLYYDRITGLKVTFQFNGGKNAKGETYETVNNLVSGAEYTVPTAILLKSNRFLGWALEGSTEIVIANGAERAVAPAAETTYVAQWQHYTTASFVVGEDTFDADFDDGADITVPTEAATAASEATAEGYTFKGWAKSADATAAEELGKAAADKNAVTFYPVYTANEYAITFDTKGGAFKEGTTVPAKETYDTNYAVPADPAKEGYIFLGWKIGDTVYTAAELANTTVKATDAITAEAQWEAQAIRVDFVVDGETVDTYFLDYEDTFVVPSYEAEGIETITEWSYNEGTYTAGSTFAFTADDLDGVTLTASSVAEEYEVTFTLDGGKWADGSTADKNVDIAYGAKIAIDEEDPAKEGFTFKGWYADNASYGSAMPGETVAFTATWDKNTYDVVYKDEEGNEIETFKAVEFGDDVPVPGDEPTKTGYEFKGWADEDRKSPADYGTLPDKALTFKPVFEALTGITASFFDADGETPIGEPVENLTYGETFTAPVPETTPDGFEFAGWAVKGTNDIVIPADAVESAAVPAENTEYVAVYTSEGLVNYTVIVMFQTVEGGDNYEQVSVQGLTGEAGTTVTIAHDENLSGYVFSEAKTDGKDSGILVEGKKYYLYYDRVVNTITWTIDGEDFDTTEVIFGGKIEEALEVPEKTGYEFKWYTDEDLTKEAAFPYVVNEDTVFYGAYSVESYTVTWIIDGVVYDEETYEYNAPITEPAITPAAGYTFKWDEHAVLMPAEDITINGTNTAIDYTLTWKINGETVDTATYNVGDTIVETDKGAKEGYTIVWDSYDVMPAQDKTINGTYQINKYTITFVINGTTIVNEYDYNAQVTDVPSTDVDNMDFVQWNDENGAKADVPATMPANDLVFVAQYKATTKAYNVTYLVDGVEYAKYLIPVGATVTEPAVNPEKAYCEFTGWSGEYTEMPANDIVRTAQFKDLPIVLVPYNDEATTVIDRENMIITGLDVRMTDARYHNEFLAVEGNGYFVVKPVRNGCYGTGSVVELYSNITGDLLETYHIVIYGDIDGNSVVNTADTAMAQDEADGFTTEWSVESSADYDLYMVMAGNVDHDIYNFITDADVARIRKVAAGYAKFDQVTGEIA